MTPAEAAELADLDAAVSEALGLGWSQRRVAASLEIERGRVARSVKRIERAKVLTALVRTEPEAPAADDAPALTDLLTETEHEIARALTTGDSVAAGRWSRVRLALLAAKAPPAPAREAFDLSKLSAAGRAALAVVHYELGALPAGHPAVAEALAAKAAIEGTLPATGDRCVACHFSSEVAARRWVCEACADHLCRVAPSDATASEP